MTPNPRDEPHRRNRRRALKRLLTLGGASVLLSPLPFRVALATGAYESSEGRKLAETFMARAMEMRRDAVAAGDQPYGAVIVKGKEIVGEGPSRVVTNQDPTAHAEMEAIRDAARHLGTRELSGCVIFATSHPCPMCETAAYWANISGMVVGSAMTDEGAPGYASC